MDVKSWIELGFGQIADSMKVLLYKHDAELFDKIRFENDAAFTEPLLFAYFNSSSEVRLSLVQILWNYFKEENKPETFEVITDNSGIAYLPEYGYLITNCEDEKLSCTYDGDLKLHRDGEKVNYRLEPIRKIGNTSISIFTYPSPLLDPFFKDSAGKPIKVTLLKNESHINNFEQALNIIKDINEDYYQSHYLPTLSSKQW